MVNRLFLERPRAVMSAAREEQQGADRPFGGVQIVVTGDVSRACPKLTFVSLTAVVFTTPAGETF
jgi:hypothetical protein